MKIVRTEDRPIETGDQPGDTASPKGWDNFTSAASKQTDVQLNRVKAERLAQDVEHGFFYDSRDDVGPLSPYSLRDEARLGEAHALQTERPSWRNLIAQATQSAFTAGNKQELRVRLLALAALTVSWMEALDRRESDALVEKEDAARALRLKIQTLPLWRRWKFWLTGKP
jgi:hypothetical protein